MKQSNIAVSDNVASRLLQGQCYCTDKRIFYCSAEVWVFTTSRFYLVRRVIVLSIYAKCIKDK